MYKRSSRSILPWNARIRAGVHTERVIATAHPAERASSQRCTTNGVAAAAGRGLGFYLGRAEPARDAR
jgi:hypothetical protein